MVRQVGRVGRLAVTATALAIAALHLLWTTRGSWATRPLRPSPRPLCGSATHSTPNRLRMYAPGGDDTGETTDSGGDGS